MDNKNENKKHRCPTCGRYLSNDVYKMREEIDQKERLISFLKHNAEVDTKELAKQNSLLKSLRQTIETQKAAIKQKEIEIAKLSKENHELKNQGFFKRLFGKRANK